jgi:hypothetical protein
MAHISQHSTVVDLHPMVLIVFPWYIMHCPVETLPPPSRKPEVLGITSATKKQIVTEGLGWCACMQKKTKLMIPTT